MSDFCLAEIEAYNPTTRAVETLRYSTGEGFTTGPSETPANTLYDARLQQPGNISRSVFEDGATFGRAKIGYGDLILLNPDGALDDLVEYGFSGRTVTLRRGEPGAAYPGGFTTIFVGTAEQLEVVGDTLRLKIRDRQLNLELPLQQNKYAGDNALPNGLEGVAGDLKGKPKPACYGTVQNVPAPCVNTAKLIYQAADAALSTMAVYDSGVALNLGRRWISRTSQFGSDALNGFTYGNGVYIAVGVNGKLSSSTDAISWTSRTSQFGTSTIMAAAYGNGVYVAVGFDGKLSSSTDGASWTSRTSQFGTSAIWDVIYDTTLNLFIAVGVDGKISTSSDGTTWTAQTSGFGSTAILSVTSKDGTVIAVGGTGKIASSTNGTTWTLRDVGLGFLTFESSAPGQGADIFVLSAVDSANNGYIITLDSLLWRAKTVQSDLPLLEDEALTLGTYYLVGGVGYLASSIDGVTWVEETSPLGAGDVRCLGYGNNVYLLGGSSGALYTASIRGYVNTTELLNDSLAPAAGEFIPYLDGGYFRLGAPPAGLITADVTEGSTAASRTAGQIFTRILQRAGIGSSGWSSGDIATLDTKNSAQIGYWTDEETTIAEVLDQVAQTVGAWWGPDQTGVYRIKRLEPPAGTAALAITASDLLRPLELIRLTDESRGLPTWRTVLKHTRNYAAQPGTQVAGTSTIDTISTIPPTFYQPNTGTVATGSAVWRSFAARFTEAKNVLDYGAIGDGVVVDRAAVTAAINALPTTGGVLYFPPGYTYNFGPASNGDNLMLFNGKYEVTVIAYGAAFTCQTTGGAPQLPRFINHSDVSGFYWYGGRFSDTGSDLSVDWKGVDVFYLWGATSSSTGRIHLQDVYAYRCVSLAKIGAETTIYRMRRIWIEGEADNCYYGVVFQENGDDSYTRLMARDCRRAYFAYGVTGFEADVHVHDTTANPGSNGLVVVHRVQRDTRGGNIRLKVTGSAEHTNAVHLSHIPPSPGTGIISNIDIYVDLADLTNPADMSPVGFSSYDSGGSLETTTSNRWDNIRIAGDFGAFLKSASGIHVYSIPNRECQVVLDPMVLPWALSSSGVGSQSLFKGFVVHVGNEEHRLKVGDITAQTITIPCWGYESNPFLLRVQHWINDGNLALQNSTYVEDVLFCYNAGGGAVGISQRSTLQNVNFTSGATITYTANGESIDCTYAGAAYTGSTSIIKQVVQRVSAWGGRQDLVGPGAMSRAPTLSGSGTVT